MYTEIPELKIPCTTNQFGPSKFSECVNEGNKAGCVDSFSRPPPTTQVCKEFFRDAEVDAAVDIVIVEGQR